MSLVLWRIIWDDGKPLLDPEDYSIGKDVGRIYRTRAAGAETKWLWAIYGLGSSLADSREDVMAAFKAAWEARESVVPALRIGNVGILD